MKTKEEVLTEFQRLHRYLCGTVKGFIELKEYNDGKACWSVTLRLTWMEAEKIVRRDEVEWFHYTIQSEMRETINEENLKKFKYRNVFD